MKYIEFHFPSLEETRDIQQVYEETLEECLKQGVPTKDQVEIQLRGNEIFTREMETELFNIENGNLFKYPIVEQIQDKNNSNKKVSTFLEKCLLEITTGKRRVRVKNIFNKDKKILNKEYERYCELNGTKSKYIKYSAEGIAGTHKNLMTVYLCTYNGDTGKRLWPDYETFLRQRNQFLYLVISYKCLEFIGGFYTSILRRLARHPMWKTRWISAIKTGQSVFGKDIVEWDVNKLYLCYWSNFYDNISEMHEPPEDFIMEDDERLDSFLEGRKTEAKRKASSGPEQEDKIVFKTRVNPVKRK